MARLRIGERQEFALQVWILDHPEDYAEVYGLPAWPARVEGPWRRGLTSSTLVFNDSDAGLVGDWLTAASNLADAYMDRARDAEQRREFRGDAEALANLSLRVAKVGR